MLAICSQTLHTGRDKIKWTWYNINVLGVKLFKISKQPGKISISDKSRWWVHECLLVSLFLYIFEVLIILNYFKYPSKVKLFTEVDASP